MLFIDRCVLQKQLNHNEAKYMEKHIGDWFGIDGSYAEIRRAGKTRNGMKRFCGNREERLEPATSLHILK